jgi:hypothetical protein
MNDPANDPTDEGKRELEAWGVNLPTALPELQEQVERAVVETRTREAATRAAFLEEKIADLPPAERPTPEERGDLARRLMEAAEAAVLSLTIEVEGQERPPVVSYVRGESPAQAADFRATLARIWPDVLTGWRVEHAERLAARDVLLKAANREKDRDELAALPEAEGRLEQAIRRVTPRARAAVRAPSAEELPILGERDGMFAPDADLADFIADLALTGAKEAAEDWRKKWRADWAQAPFPAQPHQCRNRWADSLRLPRVLARVLWPLAVRPEFERERERRDSAGVIAPVLTGLVSVSRRGAQVDLFENKARILDQRGRVVGELRMGPTIDGSLIKLSALGTLAAQRLLRFAIWEGYEKRYIRGEPNFAELWVEGGWKALAEKFGQKAGKATQEIREAAYALDAICIDTPRGVGRIFAVHEHKPGPGRPARVEMHLLGPLRPGYVTDELAAHRIAEDKRIVPVPMPSKLPPMAGRENEWAPQAQLQLLSMREFRTHAEELADRGTVEIPEKRWRDLAEEAAVPLRILAEVLGAFVAGKEDAPAFLTRPKAWDFSLADAYETERKAILSAASIAERGRAAGRKGAANRAAGRFGTKAGRRG